MEALPPMHLCKQLGLHRTVYALYSPTALRAYMKYWTLQWAAYVLADRSAALYYDAVPSSQLPTGCQGPPPPYSARALPGDGGSTGASVNERVESSKSRPQPWQLGHGKDLGRYARGGYSMPG